MNPLLAAGGGDADGHVLQRAAQAPHGVALEVGEHEDGVVVVDVGAYKVFLELLAAGDGDGDVAVLVHDVAGGDVHKAVLLHGLPVGGGGVAAALIGGVALHDGALQLLDKRPNKGGLEEVVSAGLAGGDLDGHFSLQGDAQGVIDLLQGFCGQFFSEIYLCFFHSAVTPLCHPVVFAYA